MKTLGLLGKKLGMTRIFGSDGVAIPVTVLQVGPCPIMQKKSKEKQGYNAVQVGFEEVKSHKVTKPVRGQQAPANCGFFRHVREFRVVDPSAFELGQTLTVDMFVPGEKVKVTGTSKGRGFTGVMKRWNFAGMPDSHGHEKVHRSGGSIGQCAFPSKVFKGKKMAGHTGDATVTYVNMEVVAVRPEDNVVLVKGQVPGPRQGLVILRKAQ